MRNFNSIKKNSDFQTVYGTGKSYANKLLVMYVIDNKTDEKTRIGISVSKKVGNSVVRHRLTRLIRESFRLHEFEIKTGLDIVVVVRTTAKDADFHLIESAYMHLCERHNIKKRESK